MQRIGSFSLWVAGASAMLTQMLLIRELTAALFGNELFVGWLLFCWMFWSAAFSFAFGRWIRPSPRAARAAGLAHALMSVAMPFLIGAARCGRAWIGLPIALPDLPRAMLFAFVLIAPPAACVSAIVLAVVKRMQGDQPASSLGQLLGRAYIHETLGFVGGGMLFGYLLSLVDSFHVAALVQGFNVVAAAVWYAPRATRSFFAKVSLAAAAAFTTFGAVAAPQLSRRTLPCMFPNQDVLAHGLSIYGSHTITQIGSQHNYYHAGALIGSDEDAEWNEQVVHLALLSHPAPKRILLIGGGLTGALNEILKHAPDHVDYVEMDPAFLRRALLYLPPPISAAFRDQRVRVIFADGRGFLNRSATAPDHARYDVILINTADPTSLFLNRYYTAECWQQVRALLAPGGLAAAHLSFAPDFVSPRQTRAVASVYAAMRSVFSSILLLPEYTVFFLASADRSLNYDPRPLIERLAARKIEATFVNAPYLEYRMTTDRNRQVRDAMETNPPPPNRDTTPRAMFYCTVQWLYALHPRMANAFGRLESVGMKPIWTALAALAAIAAWRIRRSAGGGLILSMAAASFSLMACETCLILLFQIIYGHLYYRIALIVASVMLGLAAGSWAGLHGDIRSARVLGLIHAGWAGLAILLALLVSRGGHMAWRIPSLFQLGMMILACVFGVFGGMEFATTNRLLFSDTRDHRRAGWMYGADLLGSCAGALLAPLWLVPLFGVAKSLGFVAYANIILGAAFTATRRRR